MLAVQDKGWDTPKGRKINLRGDKIVKKNGYFSPSSFILTYSIDFPPQASDNYLNEQFALAAGTLSLI